MTASSTPSCSHTNKRGAGLTNARCALASASASACAAAACCCLASMRVAALLQSSDIALALVGAMMGRHASAVSHCAQCVLPCCTELLVGLCKVSVLVFLQPSCCRRSLIRDSASLVRRRARCPGGGRPYLRHLELQRAYHRRRRLDRRLRKLIGAAADTSQASASQAARRLPVSCAASHVIVLPSGAGGVRHDRTCTSRRCMHAPMLYRVPRVWPSPCAFQALCVTAIAWGIVFACLLR